MFLEESKLNSTLDGLDPSTQKSVFNKIRQMIENDHLTTIFGVEAMYDYCARNIDEPGKSLEICAQEMKNYII